MTTMVAPSPCTYFRPSAPVAGPVEHRHGCTHLCRCALPVELCCAHCAMDDERIAGHDTAPVLLARWPSWGPNAQNALEALRTYALERTFVNTGRVSA